MVRALLEGRKTQTRRVLKPCGECAGQPMFPEYANGERIGDTSKPDFVDLTDNNEGVPLFLGSSPYCPGDLLYVRESFARSADQVSDSHMDTSLVYAADGVPALDNGTPKPWKPSIHMPRRYSRLTLEVTSVKVERLQDISEDDAKAEGMAFFDHGVDRYGRQSPGWHWDAFEIAKGADYCLDTARFAFGNLWEHLNHKRAPWASNPWIVALTFTVHKSNVDALLAQREAA